MTKKAKKVAKQAKTSKSNAPGLAVMDEVKGKGSKVSKKKTGRPKRVFTDEEITERKVYPWLRAKDKAKKRNSLRYQFLKDIQEYGLEEIYSKCLLCVWDRGSVDLAHKLLFAGGGDFTFDNILPLCPNCHRLNDKGGLNEIEMMKIEEFLDEMQAIVRAKRVKFNGTSA